MFLWWEDQKDIKAWKYETKQTQIANNAQGAEQTSDVFFLCWALNMIRSLNYCNIQLLRIKHPMEKIRCIHDWTGLSKKNKC